MWRINDSTVSGGDFHDVEPSPGAGTVHIALAYLRAPYDARPLDDVILNVIHEFGHMLGPLPQVDASGLDPAIAFANRCVGP